MDERVSSIGGIIQTVQNYNT